MPHYVRWIRDHRLRGATNDLVADLEMAKIKTIRENALVAVQFSADRYEIFVDNGAGANAGNYTRDADEPLLRNKDMSAGVSIDLGGLTFVNDRTRFNGRGVPPDVTNPEIIPLTSSIKVKQISINRLRHMNVQ